MVFFHSVRKIQSLLTAEQNNNKFFFDITNMADNKIVDSFSMHRFENVILFFLCFILQNLTSKTSKRLELRYLMCSCRLHIKIQSK